MQLYSPFQSNQRQQKLMDVEGGQQQQQQQQTNKTGQKILEEETEKVFKQPYIRSQFPQTQDFTEAYQSSGITWLLSQRVSLITM